MLIILWIQKHKEPIIKVICVTKATSEQMVSPYLLQWLRFELHQFIFLETAHYLCDFLVSGTVLSCFSL